MKFSDNFPLAGLAIQPDSDSDISVGKTDTWEYFHVSRPFFLGDDRPRHRKIGRKNENQEPKYRHRPALLK
jgi:hypothetical protein